MAQSFTQAYDNRQDQPDNYISFFFDYYYFEKDLKKIYRYSIFQFDKLNFFPFNLLFLIILYNLLYLLFSFLNF